MWGAITEAATSGSIMFGAVLSAVIPIIIYIVYRKLHQAGDPAWKHRDGKK
ncbi:hypothetical protein [Paenibacillus alkalitolerans]|uniref:hypothetical protein n=1 Tax=Paenibacillus alkalitolerans TaxID=2799335 RepID=UPI0018F6C3B7|nr:hypothetical protein [Paenibacillus alkalitolerans]